MKVSNGFYNRIVSLREKLCDIQEELDEIYEELEISNEDIISENIHQIEEYLNANLEDPQQFHCFVDANNVEISNTTRDTVSTGLMITRDCSVKKVLVPIGIKNIKKGISEAKFMVISETFNPEHSWVKLDEFTKNVRNIVSKFDTIKSDKPKNFVKEQVNKINDILQQCINADCLADNVKVSSTPTAITKKDRKYEVRIKTTFNVTHNRHQISSFTHTFVIKFKDTDTELADAVATEEQSDLELTVDLSEYVGSSEIPLMMYLTDLIDCVVDYINQKFEA